MISAGGEGEQDTQMILEAIAPARQARRSVRRARPMRRGMGGPYDGLIFHLLLGGAQEKEKRPKECSRRVSMLQREARQDRKLKSLFVNVTDLQRKTHTLTWGPEPSLYSELTTPSSANR